MNTSRRLNLLTAILLTITMALSFAGAAFASDDNSLADLGIRTEGAVVSPSFRYDIWQYSVQVPAGTTELELTPRVTNPSATINSVTGTTLNQDGTGTVVITVTSESGNAIEYVLNVTPARGAVDPAAAIAANESSSAVTIDTEVVQSEVETEDPRYVKVDRNSLVDAENTIEKLQKEITAQREHIRILTYVLYGLIAVSIVFLFLLIMLLLRRRDLFHELREYRENDPYRTKNSPVNAPVAEDGWGEWGEEEPVPSGKAAKEKKKKKNKKNSAEDGWGEWDDGQAGTSWAETKIGTPVQPTSTQVQPPRSSSQSSGRSSKRPDDTKMYRTVSQTGTQTVPRDVTRDLSRVNKAEARAMKKAAAAQAKAEHEERRAAEAREAEAKRQAEQARKLAEKNEAAREAQERALEKAAAERAAAELEAEKAAKAAGTAGAPAQERIGKQAEAPAGRRGNKGVEIDMIDL